MKSPDCRNGREKVRQGRFGRGRLNPSVGGNVTQHGQRSRDRRQDLAPVGSQRPPESAGGGVPPRHGGSGSADMPARRPRDALGGEGSRVDPLRKAGAGQRPIAAHLPRPPDTAQFFGAILAAECPDLRPHAVAPDLAFGPSEVSMVVTLIAGRVRRMDREIDGATDSSKSKIPGILLLTSPMGPAMTRIDPLIFGCGQG